MGIKTCSVASEKCEGEPIPGLTLEGGGGGGQNLTNRCSQLRGSGEPRSEILMRGYNFDNRVSLGGGGAEVCSAGISNQWGERVQTWVVCLGGGGTM